MGNDSQPIFLQISELICDRILDEIYLPDERIPSVRDLATELGVNPNTVMRSFERLQLGDIIYIKRGMGYFISQDAPIKIRNERRKQFLNDSLPALFRDMQLLNIGMDEIKESYDSYINKNVQK